MTITKTVLLAARSSPLSAHRGIAARLGDEAACKSTSGPGVTAIRRRARAP
jgi:hypothetical protein